MLKNMEGNKLSGLNRLAGQWEGIHGSGVYHEEWEIVNETVMKGRAYLIKKGEIINNELLKIHCDETGLYYTADVSHNSAPVSFKMTSSGINVNVFENPSHDFPQKITYEINENVSLKATVEAVKDGKTRKIEYNLRKIL
jgi:hypothetical protein